ncbi:hypothetical protein BKA67DRAFT_692649 [Truncatella angustata]|uniref:Uncharacterized protein n=1 Tax=Truncatella angustata TaxID=152316 RepID=A0A9P8UJY9_9PEZI|nr:uncharacterized protein BKA67DRAFT_692649 [Truncatella angustata]KAH6653496.1 hypothetical protein BKA67DRAFT_692649 [Truncatella angustata]
MHTRPQRIKISRSGPSLKRKAKALGEKANVLSVLMYHNAIDNRMEIEVHVPKDLKKLPDFNKLVQRAIREKSRKAKAHARALATSQPTSQTRSRTADRETSEERAQAVSLSIYDIIPDDDGDTVIVHDPSSAAGGQAHPGHSSGSVINPQSSVFTHRSDGDSVHHRISHATFESLLRDQLKRTLDDGIESLDKGGARGVLFKVTLLAYGYTFIGKGTVPAFIEDRPYGAVVECAWQCSRCCGGRREQAHDSEMGSIAEPDDQRVFLTYPILAGFSTSVVFPRRRKQHHLLSPSPIRRTSNGYWDDVQTGGLRTDGSDSNGRGCFPTESRLDTD